MAGERVYRAVLIANSTYPNDRANLYDLNGPTNDVSAMGAALTDPTFGLHDPSNVLRLIDQEKAAVEEALESFFTEASPLDQLLFYYSGHGWQDVNRFYFCTRDTRTDRPLSTAVAGQSISTMIEKSKAAATAVILDCCSSGGFKGDISSSVHGRGRWTLASSRWNQASKDAPTDAELSAFTKFVSEGLVGGDAVDLNRDGFITINELHQYVGPLVEQETGQIPHLRVEGSGELAVALAPASPSPSATDKARRGERVFPVLPIPRQAPTPDLGPEVRTVQSGVPKLTWRLESDEFSSAAIDLLDSGRDVPLRLFLQEAVREGRRRVGNAEEWESLGKILDRMTALSALSVALERSEWFSRAIAGFVQVYESAFDPHGVSRNRPDGAPAIRSEELWLAIYERVIALGGLAVRFRRWGQVRELVLQRPEGHDFRFWTNWMRHALTQASRANLFRHEEGGRIRERSVLAMTCDYVLQHDLLHPDVDDQEKILDSLCQFDFLACVVAAVTHGDEDGRHFYTNFARFYSRRVMPAARLLISDPNARAAIAPEADDEKLATALLEIHNMAHNEGFRYDGWFGYDEDIGKFINQHAAQPSGT